MAESQKGASSTSETKKKSSSLDDDIGKDFLSSWKLTSSEKDALDFTSELPPRVKKAAFDFNKIDDFEFGGEFDKMPSFKIDMSDLDFSSPRRETEKSKERSGKLSILEEDGKQDAFSFTFDFNELESFGLDSNLLKDETKTTTDNRGPDNTVRNDNSAGSRSNSTTCTDLKGKDLENLSKLDEVSSSDTEQMTACKELVVVNHGSTHTANIEFSEEPHAVDKEKNAAPVNKNSGSKEPVAVDKQITAPQVNKNSGNKNEGKNEQLKRQGSETMFSEKDVQGFSVQSGNMVVAETLPEFQPAIQLLGSLNPTKSGIEQDQSAKSLSSPDSRGSSSVNTFNLKCPSTASLRESPGVENKSQARQGGQNDMTTRRINHQKLDEKYIGDAPTMAISNAQGCVMKSTENSCSSSPITVLSSLHREPRFQMLTPLNVKGSALQSKPLDNSEATESPQSSASNPKQIHAISSMKMERLHLSPTNEKREATRKVEQALQKGVSTNSFDGELTKPGMPVPERERNKKDGFTLSLLKQTTCSSPLSTVTKLGGLAHKKLLKISSAEKDVKSDKMCEYSSLKISRLKESKNDIAITTDKKEPNIIRISDMNMEIDSRTSIAANNGITVKCALQSPPLKRKSLEGPYADSATLNPSKRISESPKGRNLTEASPKTNPRLVTDKNQVQRTENKEGIPNDVSFDPQISSEVVTSEASMMDTDIPLVLENYGNVEKAEACAKELDDICNMLRKKHEEAKELLVRAVVNNNSLLMLNHPMYEEKIRSLQRFSTALLSKDYES